MTKKRTYTAFELVCTHWNNKRYRAQIVGKERLYFDVIAGYHYCLCELHYKAHRTWADRWLGDGIDYVDDDTPMELVLVEESERE